jgi:hypothetical protein
MAQTFHPSEVGKLLARGRIYLRVLAEYRSHHAWSCFGDSRRLQVLSMHLSNLTRGGAWISLAKYSSLLSVVLREISTTSLTI